MRFSRRATTRLATLFAALAAGVVGPALASAQPAAHQQSAVSPFFSATGFLFFGSFNAVSDAGGPNPSGQVSYRVGGPTSGFDVSGTVVCLAVSGNTAVIGFQGTINRPLVPPEPVVGELVVADNGPAGSGLDTVGASERAPATGPPNCSAPGPVEPRRVSGDVIVHPPRGRMVGKGSLLVDGPPAPASYAYILSCSAAANTNAPFEVRLGGQRFRLTSTSSVSCTDDPAVATPAAGFDTMTGRGTGTLTSDGPGTIQFRFVDGGAGGANDLVQLTITDASGRFFGGTAAPPGKFPGSDQATGNNTAQTR